jgi:hypothetical protein
MMPWMACATPSAAGARTAYDTAAHYGSGIAFHHPWNQPDGTMG